MLDAFIQWLMKFVREVPGDIAVCEFDCRKTECLMGRREHRERRRQAIDEGGERHTH